MIEFSYENDFIIPNEEHFISWIKKIVTSEGKTLGDLLFVFCNDDFLLELNIAHLQHDTLTDILTFDYCVGDELHGDIFISTERVKDNAKDFCVSFDNELLRVIAHGVLHLCKYNDKSDIDTVLMRAKESEKMTMYKNL